MHILQCRTFILDSDSAAFLLDHKNEESGTSLYIMIWQ